MTTELWRPCVDYPNMHISHPSKFVRNASTNKLLVRSVKLYNDGLRKVSSVNVDIIFAKLNPSPTDWVLIPNHTRYSINGRREIRHNKKGHIRSPNVGLSSGMMAVSVNGLYDSTWGENAPNTTLGLDPLAQETWKSSELFSGYEISHPGRYVRTCNNQRILVRTVTIARPIEDIEASYRLDVDELVKTLNPQGFTPIPCNPVYEVNEQLVVRHKVHLSINPLQVKVLSYRGLAYHDLEHLYEMAFIPVEQRRYYHEICSLQEQYPDVDTSVIYQTSPLDRGNLLCIRRPEILPELVDQSRIFTLSAGTKELEDWKCIPHGTHHRRTVVDRAVQNCRPDCCHLTKEQLAEKGHASNLIGEETEKYCEELMSHVSGVIKVTRVGHLSSPCHDIEASLVDSKARAVQTKTLWQSKQNPRQFCISSLDGYDPGVLIVAVNPKFPDLGFVCLAGELPESTDVLTISFSTRARTYTENKVSTREDLLDKIAKYLPLTVEVSHLQNIYCEYHLRERESLLRLESECIKRGISYRPHSNNYEVIDCWLQEQSSQAKYTNVQGDSMWKCGISKSAPGGSSQPYSIMDNIKFFVFELDKAYPGQFMIVPMEEMIEQGYITTLEQDGRKKIYLPPPDYPDKSHWAMKYWNNFSQLTAL